VVEVDAYFPTVRSRLTREGEREMNGLVDEITAAAWRLQRLDDSRWAGPLTVLLAALGARTVLEIGRRVIAGLGGNPALPSGKPAWSPDGTTNYVLAIADGIAVGHLQDVRRLVNGATGPRLEEALQAGASELLRTPERMVDTTANFAANDAAERVGAREKRWQVNSGHPRSSHARLNGQVVPVGQNFSNGMPYPRSGGPPAEVANCKCSMVLIQPEG